MSEVGIIGQMYEDRRTKKCGKLISRDEKCKTMMFEAPDGKCFISSYSSFKSNMRKKIENEEEVIKEAYEDALVQEDILSSTDDSVAVEEDISTESEEVELAEPVHRKAHKPHRVSEITENVTLKLLDFAKSFNNPRVNLTVRTAKRLNMLFVDKRAVFDLYPVNRKNQFKCFIKEDVYRDTDWDLEFVEVFRHPTYSKPICVYGNYADFDKFLEKLRPYVIERLSDEIIEEED